MSAGALPHRAAGVRCAQGLEDVRRQIKTQETHRGSLPFSPLSIFVPKARVNAEVRGLPVVAGVVYESRKIVAGN